MKKILVIFLISTLVFSSCKDKWDDYFNSTYKGVQSEELSMTITEFLESKPEYSNFYALLKSVGMDAEFNKDQLLTVWVVNNDNLLSSPVTSGDSLQIKYHVNYLPFSTTDLKNGLRIMALNGVYIQINSSADSLCANESKIIKSYRLKNGVIHEIRKSLFPKINMFEYVKRLGDDYSIIRDSIFQYNVKVFDVASSKPVGVDKTGNTIYDSVFYLNNSYFFTKANFKSEYSQFTAFLPSNTVIKACFDELSDKYIQMGTALSKADSLLAMQWIKEAVFYNGIITNFSQTDISSAFSRIWRTTVQQLDLNNPVPCSNGMVYKVTKLKVPNNVMISRIKSYVQYWAYLPADQRGLFKINFTDVADSALSKIDGGAAAGANYSPDQDLWKYWCLQVGSSSSTAPYSVTFPPLERYYDDAGTPHARVMKVPPGEYTFYMGFFSGKTTSAHPYVDVYFNGQLIQSAIQASKSTPWNFDRVTETATDRKVVGAPSKFDGLGGLVGTVTIPGTEMTSFEIKVAFNKIDGTGTHLLKIYHWALKPTSNNY
jgi:hypothetical protein